MRSLPSDRPIGAFRAFVDRAEPRLRIALVATYGADVGRTATVDALSWAWEHWDRVETMTNPVGYLYRVGQTAARGYDVRPVPFVRIDTPNDEFPISPELVAAIQQLPPQQRTALMLVHAFGWTLRDVGQLLGITASTVREHVTRATTRLASNLEERHVI